MHDTKHLLFKINTKMNQKEEDKKIGIEHILEGHESWTEMGGKCMSQHFVLCSLNRMTC